MLYLRLFAEFFKTGLFAVGGGMATLPFLQNIGEVTGWYTYEDLMNMLAISESTPGPIGINMATYVGFTAGGLPGAVIATLGEVTPSIIVILMVAVVMNKFRESRYVNSAFYGLRPASTGLIGAACATVTIKLLTSVQIQSGAHSLLKEFSVVRGEDGGLFFWKGIALAAVLLVFTNFVKPTKKWHPIIFIGISALVGILFRFAGI